MSGPATGGSLGRSLGQTLPDCPPLGRTERPARNRQGCSHPLQTLSECLLCGVPTAVRLPARQAGGHWFEPSIAHDAASLAPQGMRPGTPSRHRAYPGGPNATLGRSVGRTPTAPWPERAPTCASTFCMASRRCSETKDVISRGFVLGSTPAELTKWVSNDANTRRYRQTARSSDDSRGAR